ncbi:MAG: hypothetical protein LUC41_05040, partial [Clostridiales bacterium]|nr:hypothetical protein [Clostridiales bacterium]
CAAFCEVATRIGFAFLFSYLMGYRGLWLVSPITWCCAAVLCTVRYVSGGWKKKAMAVADTPSASLDHS